jgi:hypothetical protein
MRLTTCLKLTGLVVLSLAAVALTVVCPVAGMPVCSTVGLLCYLAADDGGDE